MKSAYEMQKERAETLLNKCWNEDAHEFEHEKVRSLCAKHSELINDFDVVREMNTVMSFRFDEVLERFPLVNELDHIIETIDQVYPKDDDERFLRTKMLKSFRKICEALQKHNEQIRPKSYAESVNRSDESKIEVERHEN